MKRIILTSDNRFKHWDLTGKDPEGIIVSDKIAFDLSQDTEHKQYDINTQKIKPFKKPFDLMEEKKRIKSKVANDREKLISQGVASSALGVKHLYSSDSDFLILVNLILSIGKGGDINCLSSLSVEKQRPHSHAQVVILVNDIISNRSDLYNRLEIADDEIEAASNEITLSSIKL